MAYGDFEDLAKRIASGKVLGDKAFNIAKNPKYDEYQRRLASMVYNFLIKSLQAVVLICIQIIQLNKIINLLNTNQLLKFFKKEQFVQNLKKIWGC